MTISTKQKLNNGSEALGFCNAIASLGDADEQTRGFGSMIASTYTPGFVVRSGLTSSATHIEERPGLIHAVLDAAGAAERSIIHVGAPGAGQVLVTYDAAGVPTLLFGDGANTGYRVLKSEGPLRLADALARGWPA